MLYEVITPLNFDYKLKEKAVVQVIRNNLVEHLELTEEGVNSAWFSAMLPASSGITEISYGYGYFKQVLKINFWRKNI